jgi:hypothetical protein
VALTIASDVHMKYPVAVKAARNRSNSVNRTITLVIRRLRLRVKYQNFVRADVTTLL